MKSSRSARSLSISSGVITTFGARVITAILSIAAGILVARTLGQEGKGVYSGVQIFLSLITAISGGFGSAIVFMMTKRRKPIAELIRPLGIVWFTLTVLALLGLCINAALHGWTLSAAVIAIACPAGIVLSWQSGYLIGEGRLRSLNAQTVVFAGALLCGATIILLGLHLNIVALLSYWVACMYLAAAFVTAQALRSRPRRVRESALTLPDMVRFGGHSMLNSFLGALNYRIDSLILIGMLGYPVFGVYSISVSFGEMLFMISRPITQAASREIGIADAHDSAIITARTIRISTGLAFAAAVIVAFLAPSLIRLLYGASFISGIIAFEFLLPGIVVFASAGTFAAFFLFQIGRPGIVTSWNVFMIVVQAIACVLLVPKYGINGAAASSTLTYVAGAAMNTWWFNKISNVRARDVWVIQKRDIDSLMVIFAALPQRLFIVHFIGRISLGARRRFARARK